MFYVTGCASTRQSKDIPQPIETDHPGWVEKGGGFFPGDRGSAIYGVGFTDHAPNVGVAKLRTASDVRARAAVGAVISTHVEELTKLYQSYVTDASTSDVEDWMRQVTLEFTKANLSGVSLENHHNCMRDKVFYSLARMDFNTFNSSVEKMENLSQRAKDAIEEHAQKMFDEMAQRSGQL